jgi:hypothetical protein
MYLAQSWRLKHKRAGSSFRLPTLESTARLNRQCLVVSTVAVAGGVAAGVVMNLNRWGSVGWTDRGVMLSLLLFLWLAAATALEFFYAPTSHGRKAIYLTLASLGFLILAMFGILTTSHGQGSPETSRQSGTSRQSETSRRPDLPPSPSATIRSAASQDETTHRIESAEVLA